MEEGSATNGPVTCGSATAESQVDGEVNGNAKICENGDLSDNHSKTLDSADNNVEINGKDESGVIVDSVNVSIDVKSFIENEHSEVHDDARSLEDLDSLPAGDELALAAAGSDSGVEGCGRALSSGGGSRSCASSVVSCGSGCGSESSSLAGAPPRPRRRVNVTVTEPKRNSPLGSSTPRPVTAPRGPNLATRERARSREKPVVPEKPRPLTPKPRIRPTTDLPNLIRESPALRAKPTKTSTARCRTPNSPSEEKRWPINGPRLTTSADASATRVAADKYGTLPRRRTRDPDADGSPKHENTPPSCRRPTVARSLSSRSTTKTRVRIYAEKTSQTVLVGSDIESAFAGVVPNIDSRVEVTRCHKGVQASSRDTELTRLTTAAATAEASAAEERERRAQAETQLAAERAARLAALAELERNSQRLLELAGSGADAGAEGCLRALEEQLRAARELAATQRADTDALREHCAKLHVESCSARESVRSLEARLAEAEREAAEMHDFLAAETAALGDSLRDAEAESTRLAVCLERSRAECRQLVRMCEQRRQEALAASARARSNTRALHALDALARRLRTLTNAARSLPPCSRSESFEAQTPEEEPRGILAAVTRALRSAPQMLPHYTQPQPPALNEDDRSRISDENDNSADLLDSETEPCLVTDPEYAEEWWSGAENAGAWSADELSPERESVGDDKDAESASVSERDSLRNLSAAIAQRHRSEEDAGSLLLDRVLQLDAVLQDLLPTTGLAHIRDKADPSEKMAADVMLKKLAELDASKAMVEHYRATVESLKKQLAQAAEEDNIDIIEEELAQCDEEERRARYEALDAASAALAERGSWPALRPLRLRLERLALAAAAPRAPAPRPPARRPGPHSAATTPTHASATPA